MVEHEHAETSISIRGWHLGCRCGRRFTGSMWAEAATAFRQHLSRHLPEAGRLLASQARRRRRRRRGW